MDRGQSHYQFVTVSSWAQRELKFAARDGRVAERAERHARHGPRAMQPEWTLIASIHRRNQRRHLAAARLHFAHAKRLNKWERRSGSSPRLPFVAAVADACGTSSVIVTLFGGTRLDAVVAASDSVGQTAHDLEATFGEGPGRDAVSSGEPVLAAGGTLVNRWPLYGPAVGDLGVRAVRAAALSVAGRSIGVLTALHPHRAAPAARVPVRGVAEALAFLLLARRTADFADELPPVPLLGDGDDQLVIHQAAGMVAAEAGVDIPAAVALIRAHAFAEGLSAEAVATQVLSRDLDLAALA